MTQFRPGSAVRRVSDARVGFDDQPMPAFRGRSDYPEWRIPRVVRGTGAPASVPQRVPAPAPRADDQPAPEPPRAAMSRDSFRLRPTRSRPRLAAQLGVGLVPVIAACLLGVASGGGGAYLLELAAPQTAERLGLPVKHVIAGIGATATAWLEGTRQKDVAATPRMESKAISIPAPSALPAPGTPPAPGGSAAASGSDLDRLLERAQRQLAEHKLEQPAGDNALDSYRLLAAKWPQEKRVAALGGTVGVTFWSMANDAKAAGNWQQALHYFEIVNALPPLPAAAVPSSPAQ